MSATFFKRYRMDADLRQRKLATPSIPPGYRAVAWSQALLEVHAMIKWESFRNEIDAMLFPCLGELEGCERLMGEIAAREGFMPEATWLIEYVGAGESKREYCGTIQGIQSNGIYGGIQNVGVTPFHRRRGLGALLVELALNGFQNLGLCFASLEVTVQNASAVRLYEDMGFRRVKTIYKAAEVAWN